MVGAAPKPPKLSSGVAAPGPSLLSGRGVLPGTLHATGWPMSRDINTVWLLWGKCCLFVALGTLAAALVWVQAPTAFTAVMQTLMVWAFCRAYYFCFHVLQRWVDPTFRFAGLSSLLKHLAQKKGGRTGVGPGAQNVCATGLGVVALVQPSTAVNNHRGGLDGPPAQSIDCNDRGGRAGRL